jgi:hypothetical protein
MGSTPAPRRRRGLVIAWMSTSQRSTTLAQRLDFDLVLLGRAGFRRPWTAPFAYPVLLMRSAREIIRRRPRAVLVVAPPIVAPMLVVPIVRLARARVGIDIHSGAFLDRRWRWSMPILRLLGSHASANVVTLQSLARRMGRASARTIVLPDPLPSFSAPLQPDHTASKRPGGMPLVVAIAGWGDDEPLQELAEAATDQHWELLITGKPRWKVELPPNASLTGFLSDAAYAQTLRRADVLVVLTTRPETLLSGAWEGIALHKALVLSDTAALHETFLESVTYAQPTAVSIRRGVGEALEGRGEFEKRAAQLADRLEIESEAGLAQLLAALMPVPAAR